jgi:hypothetical protein
VSAVVGVHGIAQQQVGRHQLRAPWSRALADGVERATGARVGVPDLDIAFFGDLFLPRGRDGAKGDGAQLTLADISDADVAFVLAAADEVLTDSELLAAAQAPPKGFPGLPGPVLAVIAAVDRRFGAHAGPLFVGELAQVRRYLTDTDLKRAVDARVAEAVGAGTRVVIGHSLGSVVALEHLRLCPTDQVELLLTLGSPLGLRAIRELLPDPGFGTGPDGPANAGRWVNLRDRRDPVALAGDLRSWWPTVEDDDTLDNGRSPHAAERYLSKRQTGTAVRSALTDPPAASPMEQT